MWRKEKTFLPLKFISSSALYSSNPKFTMKPSLHPLIESEILSSPPKSWHIADQALGENSETGTCLCHGMLTLSAVQVLLSVGDIPSLVHIVDENSAAWARVKHCGILMKPCSRKWAFCSSERVKSESCVMLGISDLIWVFRVKNGKRGIDLINGMLNAEHL